MNGIFMSERGKRKKRKTIKASASCDGSESSWAHVRVIVRYEERNPNLSTGVNELGNDVYIEG